MVVHVLTKKGMGYEPASLQPDRFHGTGPFEIKSGSPLSSQTEPSYTDVFSKKMVLLGEKNKKLTAITAAMREGTGLKSFSRNFPDRFFDVGIAEEHAVTFAAGLALGGMIPVVAIYSSFLQRAVDQILHDVCMQKLHVIFAVDRAGLVGADGETHQGNFDLSYLSMMPNMVVMAPKNARELEEMLEFAVKYDGPCAIRYPRGKAYQGLLENQAELELGKSEVLEEGKEIAVLGVGSICQASGYRASGQAFPKSQTDCHCGRKCEKRRIRRACSRIYGSLPSGDESADSCNLGSLCPPGKCGQPAFKNRAQRV